MRVSRLIVLSLVAASIARSAMPQAGNCTQIDSSSRPDCPRALAFFHNFQSAFREGDRQKVAALVDYPVRVSIHHKPVLIRNQAQLLARFDQIFDEGVLCTILNGDEKDVWGNWQGFTVDGGSVWFDAIIPRGEKPDIKAPDYWTKYPFKIKAINNDAYYPCDPAHKHQVENSPAQGSIQSSSNLPFYLPPDQISLPLTYATLASLSERSLFEASKDTSIVAFRLSYFSPQPVREIAVRLLVNADGSGQVISAVSSGKATEVQRNRNGVSIEEVNKLLQLLAKVEFWSMPSAEDVEQKTDAAGRKAYVMDGSVFTVEGVRQGLFHSVSRLNPKPGPITEIACYLATDLAKPAIPPFQSRCAGLGR
jgi:hypothetical protein